MNIDDLILKRISCRNFSSEELSEQQLQLILDAARFAPSPKNRQPWRFFVLRQKQKQDFMELFTEKQGKATKQSGSVKRLNEWDSHQKTVEIMLDADTIVLVFNIYPSQIVFARQDFLFDIANIQSIGAATENMLLKATDLGIKSLWICDIFSHYQRICDKYCPTGQLIAAVAFGYGHNKTRSTRKPLTELLIKKEE